MTAFGDKVVNAALAFIIAGIPVLHGGVFDLGTFEGDQFDHGSVQLIAIARRRGAAFNVRHIRSLVGDDQRALELSGVDCIDTEVGRQLDRALQPFRDVAERAVGKHRGIQRGEKVVAGRHHGA